MYKSLVILLMLAGCAAGPSPQVVEYKRYVDENRPLALNGSMKWTIYYAGLYDRMLAANAPMYVLNIQNGLTNAAEDLEAGRITEQEFQRRRRDAQVQQQAAFENEQREQYAAQQQRQALGAAQMAAGLQMMQASQPQHYMLPIKPYQPPQTYGNAYATGYSPTQTINGSLKYCKYSNGQIITVASHELCPISTK